MQENPKVVEKGVIVILTTIMFAIVTQLSSSIKKHEHLNFNNSNSPSNASSSVIPEDQTIKLVTLGGLNKSQFFPHSRGV